MTATHHHVLIVNRESITIIGKSEDDARLLAANVLGGGRLDPDRIDCAEWVGEPDMTATDRAHLKAHGWY